MKKKDIILILGVVLVVVLAIFVVNGGDTRITLSGDEVGSIKIDYPTYASKIENNENFMFVIESTNCGYCEMYMPILEEVANELSIPIYYIDISELSSDESNQLASSNTYLMNEQWGTPTTLLMSGDKVVASISQYVEKDELVKFINKRIILKDEELVEE